MNTDIEIPLLEGAKPGRFYPDRGRVGAAWEEAYRALSADGGWLDGVELAKRLGKAHDLNPDTLIGLFTRMATAGKLDRRPQDVKTTRGARRRTHYRIPQKG